MSEAEVFENIASLPEDTKTYVDSFRFDAVLHTEECSYAKLSKDVRMALKDATGRGDWMVSIEDPADMEVIDVPYEDYENSPYSTMVIMVTRGDRPEMSSTTALQVREACLTGLAKADKGTAYSNGIGDMSYDTVTNDVEWIDIPLHASVVIDTGGFLDGLPDKNISALRWSISMPDNTHITSWGGVHIAITHELAKIGWATIDTDYNPSDKFGGNMYRWTVTMAPTEVTAASAKAITAVWDACLTGIHNYRLGKPDSIILVANGIGKMQVKYDRWADISKIPSVLYVG